MCECGCGKQVRIGRRFISGHNTRMRKHSEETKSRISEKHLLNHGHTLKDGVIVLPTDVPCECGCGEFVKSNHRGNRLNKYVNGHNQRGKPSGFLGHTHPEVWKQQNSERHKGNQHALGNRFAYNEEQKRNRSERMIGNWHKLGYKDTEETTQRRRKSQKKLWANPVYHKKLSDKMARGNQRNRPNKLEIKSRDLLNYLYPKEWPYTGDCAVVIGGKNPDFVNEKRKLIIEVWGTYWHRGQNPKDRIDHFKPFGYRTLVIWEHELKSPRLIGKIRTFVEAA